MIADRSLGLINLQLQFTFHKHGWVWPLLQNLDHFFFSFQRKQELYNLMCQIMTITLKHFVETGSVVSKAQPNHKQAHLEKIITLS